MTGHIPKDLTLDESTGVDYFKRGYQNWTVGDLVDILADHNPDAPVFIAMGSGVVRPLESFTGGPGAEETIFM